MTKSESEACDLLASSRLRWKTLRASGREWRNHGLVDQAWQARHARMRAEGRHFTTINVESKTQRSNERSADWALWVAPPWRRAQFEVGFEAVDVVFRDSMWWSNGHGISRTNGGSPCTQHGSGPGEDLLRTKDYVDLINITNVGSGEWIGRATLELGVTIRHDLNRTRGPGLHGLVIGDPDRIELTVDEERGVVLRSQTWMGGHLCRAVEVTDVAFDEQFEDGVFEIEPLPGQAWVDLSA